MTLVIMAAGMGSRYGGLKQIEPVNDNGEFIIDYSIFDAIRVGFKKVIIIIKEENYDLFKETIGKRIESQIKVEYVFQNNDILVNVNRVKPLGTGYAIYCVKDKIKDNFAVINADDFYGYDAFKKAYDYLKNTKEEFATVAYHVYNTISDNGSVKRGLCKSKDGYVTKLVESVIEKKDNKYIANPLDGSDSFDIMDDDLASMNFFCFTPKIIEYLEESLKEFLNNKDLVNDELLITDVINERIESKTIKLKELKTSSVWYGVTFKEDKEKLVNGINKLVNSGEYPSKLWA